MVSLGGRLTTLFESSHFKLFLFTVTNFIVIPYNIHLAINSHNSCTQMKKYFQDLIIVIGDGNCFYRRISLAFYETEDNWSNIKRKALEFLIENRKFLFADFSEEFIEEAIKLHSEENQ